MSGPPRPPSFPNRLTLTAWRPLQILPTRFDQHKRSKKAARRDGLHKFSGFYVA
jgi:hypothetical protein